LPVTGNELLITYEILLQFFMDSGIPGKHAILFQDADLFTKQVCRDTARFSQDDHACGVIPWMQSEEKRSAHYALGRIYKIERCRTVGTCASGIFHDFGERMPDPFFDHPVRIERNERLREMCILHPAEAGVILICPFPCCGMVQVVIHDIEDKTGMWFTVDIDTNGNGEILKLVHKIQCSVNRVHYPEDTTHILHICTVAFFAYDSVIRPAFKYPIGYECFCFMIYISNQIIRIQLCIDFKILKHPFSYEITRFIDQFFSKLVNFHKCPPQMFDCRYRLFYHISNVLKGAGMMPDYHFTEKDFKVFNIEGLEPRMEALIENI